MLVGYHPGRVRALAAQTSAAIDDLGAIDCSEPAAGDARQAIWLARRNLAELWMPLLHRLMSSDAMTAWTAPPPGVESLRVEWAHTSAWLTVTDNETHDWSDDRLIAAVIAHDGSWRSDADGRPVDPFTVGDDLFVDAMQEIARRAAADTDFAAQLLADAGATATLGIMVAGGAFDPSFTATVGRRLLGPASAPVLPSERQRHAYATSAVLDRLASWPDVALDMLADADVRDGLVRRADLRTDAVREFVGAGLHLSVLADPTQLQHSLDALTSFVPLSHQAQFPPGLAQGIAAAVGTHMDHLGRLLDAGAGSFFDVDAIGSLDVAGDPVTYADLSSLYGRVVRDPDAQRLLEVGLTDFLEAQLEIVPAAIEKSAAAAHPRDLGDIIRTQVEPVVKALTLVFGDAAAFEQRRIDELLAARRADRNRAIDVGFTLAGALAATRPITTLLKVGEDVRPSAPGGDDRVPENDALARLDGVVAREALRLVVASDELRVAAGLDVVDDDTWRRLTEAADDPSVDFSNRGALMHQLAIDGPDGVLVETFLAEATGTVDATPG
ncbi:MAG: hypothetical protein HKN44_16025 [Ilumatobacter sp.]|nr:hypothetical protein [Ilumatobacter sp.]